MSADKILWKFGIFDNPECPLPEFVWDKTLKIISSLKKVQNELEQSALRVVKNTKFS